MPLPRKYYVYILSNAAKTVLYTGVTNNLHRRIIEHYQERGKPATFAGRHHAHHLLYYETTPYILNAIAREKQIKGWSRAKKDKLISSVNPTWRFLNDELFGGCSSLRSE